MIPSACAINNCLNLYGRCVASTDDVYLVNKTSNSVTISVKNEFDGTSIATYNNDPFATQNQNVTLTSLNQKIKLTDDIKSRYNSPGDTSRRILSFNHYGSGQYKWRNEEEVVNEFFNWLERYEPCLFVAQNASFDMNMLSGRFGHKITNEVFDTKMLIQLYYLPLIQKLAETDIKYKELINFIGTSSRDNGLISSSLSKIGPALGLNMSGYHDALTDCRLALNMYSKIVDFLKENQSVDIMKYQVERIKVIRG